MVFDMADYAQQTVDLYTSITGTSKFKHAATPFPPEGSVSQEDEEARGYYLAYAVSEDPTRPPESQKWYMDCRSDGWKELNFSPIVGEVVAGNIFDRVNKTIQITSPLCSSRKALMNDVFQLQGETDNGAPLFKSLRGNYLYHGPRCGIGQTGKKWIISPLLCSSGFSLAYRQTEDGTAPPMDDEWMVNCDRTGWQHADIQFSVVPMIGRIRTASGFCLEVYQRRAVLQPCNTEDAQLWIYNTSSGQLRDRNGLCLEASGIPVLETQAIGIPVDMGDCLDGSSAQSWESLGGLRLMIQLQIHSGVCGASGSPVAAKNVKCNGMELSLGECEFEPADDLILVPPAGCAAYGGASGSPVAAKNVKCNGMELSLGECKFEPEDDVGAAGWLCCLWWWRMWCKWFTGSCKERELQWDGAELGIV
eukprot:s1388_g1.t1